MLPPAPDLPRGWKCTVELTENVEGAVSGKAELRQDGESRCIFVISQQASRETAYARLQFRADHFIQEWEARSSSESKH